MSRCALLAGGREEASYKGRPSLSQAAQLEAGLDDLLAGCPCASSFLSLCLGFPILQKEYNSIFSLRVTGHEVVGPWCTVSDPQEAGVVGFSFR